MRRTISSLALVLGAAAFFCVAERASAQVIYSAAPTVTYVAPAPVAVTTYRYGILPRRQVTVATYATPVVAVEPVPVVRSYYVAPAPVVTYVAPAPVIVRRPILRPVVIYP